MRWLDRAPVLYIIIYRQDTHSVCVCRAVYAVDQRPRAVDFWLKDGDVPNVAR